MTDSISIYEKYNIDLNRLSRDYLKFPLRRQNHIRNHPLEIPTKEDLEYLYLELNLSQGIIYEIFHWNNITLSKNFKYYNIVKPKELENKSRILSKNLRNPNWKEKMVKKQKQTMLKKYGRDNYFKGEEGKKAVVDACMKKYGVKSTSQLLEVKEKYKQTCMERYNVTNVMQNAEFQEKNHTAQLKTKSTIEHHQKMISLWNKKTKEQQEAIKEKMQNTCTERYGVTNIFKNNTYIKEKLKNKYPNIWAPQQVKYTNIENFNEKYIKENFIIDGKFYIDNFKEYFNIKENLTINNIYKKHFNIVEENFYTKQKETEEIKWIKSIDKNNLVRGYIIKYKNKKFKPDGYDPKTNTIYEFLGDYWHGNPNTFNLNEINIWCNKTFEKLYIETFERFNIIKSLGYKIIYIWESDFIKNGKIKEDWKEKMREY